MSRLEEAYAIFERAEKCRAACRFTEAIPLYKEAKSGARTDAELRADCAFALGDTYRMIGEFTLAAKSYCSARTIAVKLGPGYEELATDAAVGLGLARRATGGYAESTRLFNSALKSYRAGQDRAGEAFVLWARAGVYRFKGDVKRAMEGFRASRDLFKRLKDSSGVAYSLAGLGGASRVLGRHKDSFRYYSHANRLFLDLNDTFGTAYTYCGIANSMRMQGDFSGSLEDFSRAKRSYKRIGDRVSYAYTLWGEGTALAMLGRLSTARRRFEEADGLFTETRDSRGRVYCMISMGTLAALSDEAKGVRKLNRALKRALSLGLKTEAGYARDSIKAAKAQALPLNLA
jgi:tetratricopeptide (TPR) repeat protein